MQQDYQDILHSKRPISKRTPMSMQGRAAQFAPFAALVGHSDAMRHTARQVDGRIDLDENEQAHLQQSLAEIADLLARGAPPPAVELTYFVPDAEKAGGVYQSVCGKIRKIDCISRQLILQDGQKIPIDDVISLTFCR